MSKFRVRADMSTAYGWSASGVSTTEVGGDRMVDHGYVHTSGIPQRAAPVWYLNSAGTGHVVVSLDEGMVVGGSVPQQDRRRRLPVPHRPRLGVPTRRVPSEPGRTCASWPSAPRVRATGLRPVRAVRARGHPLEPCWNVRVPVVGWACA
jgi:hypothetical protein